MGEGQNGEPGGKGDKRARVGVRDTGLGVAPFLVAAAMLLLQVTVLLATLLLLIITLSPELKSCTVTGEGVDDVKLFGLRAAEDVVKRWGCCC